jgi:hypothetical protein
MGSPQGRVLWPCRRVAGWRSPGGSNDLRVVDVAVQFDVLYPQWFVGGFLTRSPAVVFQYPAASLPMVGYVHSLDRVPIVEIGEKGVARENGGKHL